MMLGGLVGDGRWCFFLLCQLTFNIIRIFAWVSTKLKAEQEAGSSYNTYEDTFYNKTLAFDHLFLCWSYWFCSGLPLDLSVSKLAWHIGRDCSDATHTSIMPVPNDLATCWVSLLYFFSLLYTELNEITVHASVSCSASMYPLDFTLYRNSQC